MPAIVPGRCRLDPADRSGLPGDAHFQNCLAAAAAGMFPSVVERDQSIILPGNPLSDSTQDEHALTHAIHNIATENELLGMNKAEFNVFNKEITAAAEISAKNAERNVGNFEDQVRVANELLRGLEIIASTNANDAEKQPKSRNCEKACRHCVQHFWR